MTPVPGGYGNSATGIFSGWKSRAFAIVQPSLTILTRSGCGTFITLRTAPTERQTTPDAAWQRGQAWLLTALCSRSVLVMGSVLLPERLSNSGEGLQVLQ